MTERARWMGYLPLDDLIPAARNPKNHHADIGTSLRRFGYVEAIALDERTGRLVAGHGRVDELRAKRASGEDPPEGVEIGDDGEWVVPVQRGWSSSSDEEADAYLIASNQLVIAGGWNPEELDKLTAALADIDIDLSGLGLPDPATIHVEAHDRHHAEARGIDEVQQRVNYGDIWELGRHRLACGDCRVPGDVAALLDGATINVAFTSPPYADRRKYDEASAFKPVPPSEYVAWFAPVAAHVAEHLAPDGSWFVNIKPGVTPDNLDTELYVLDLVAAHVREWGWHFATELCWEKHGMPGNAIQRFKNQFEPVYQFTRGRWKMRPEQVAHVTDSAIYPLGPGSGESSWANAQGSAVEGRTRFNQDRRGEGIAYPGNRLPTFTGSHEAVGHTAAFPVGLPAWFFRAYSDPGDSVYDPFVGSGSSLLAAEQEGRVGFGMEISPGYCDVILDRWERHGGQAPKRTATS